MTVYRQTNKNGKNKKFNDRSKTYLNEIKKKQQHQAKFIRMFKLCNIFSI